MDIREFVVPTIVNIAAIILLYGMFGIVGLWVYFLFGIYFCASQWRSELNEGESYDFPQVVRGLFIGATWPAYLAFAADRKLMAEYKDHQ